MVKSPRTPFPSFTLVLSRQAAGDHNESNIDAQERNASNAEPSIDLMKTFDHRLSHYDSWNLRDATDEDRSDTETVFEERIDIVVANNKGSRGLRKLSVIFRMLKCITSK